MSILSSLKLKCNRQTHTHTKKLPIETLRFALRSTGIPHEESKESENVAIDTSEQKQQQWQAIPRRRGVLLRTCRFIWAARVVGFSFMYFLRSESQGSHDASPAAVWYVDVAHVMYPGDVLHATGKPCSPASQNTFGSVDYAAIAPSRSVSMILKRCIRSEPNKESKLDFWKPTISGWNFAGNPFS